METNNRIIAYTQFSGIPFQLTFLGGEWWITTPGEPLKPVSRTLWDDLHFLTTCGGSIAAIDLAKMLGCTVENPCNEVYGELCQRMNLLHRLDCTEGWKGQILNFEWSIEKKKKPSNGFENEYSLRCKETHYNMWMINQDGFEDEETAQDYLDSFLGVLIDEGIEFKDRKVKKIKNVYEPDEE